MDQFGDVCRKFFNKKYYTIIIGVLSVCVIGLGLIFSKAIVKGNQYMALGELVPVPPPTEIDPNFIKQVNECFLPTATVYGYTLRITAGFRSMADQTALYQEGRTIDGHIVTEAPAGKSIHNYGFAVDVVDRYRGYDIDWDKLIKIGAYCGLESGGPGDLPHFEHRAGLSTADFAAGMRPPSLKLPCAIMDERAKAGQLLTLQDLQSCNAPNF
jgi:peptidoglycan L-alanyl-D-glutamate endopeptidase CwlK